MAYQGDCGEKDIERLQKPRLRDLHYPEFANHEIPGPQAIGDGKRIGRLP